ncbi:unnamed protein product [Phyllotreta striolata]|uniref:Piezo-type mechanosensitive ion channel component n=1 Tax=Phyllotreta striolata TaxID=444603 RepID=A0A9N9TY02_PHYSR|nr:unnamed protein product [Phyllotreta striolata]
MVRYLANLVLFRLVFPLIILICLLFRPSLFSFIYLLFMLIIPFVPVPTPETIVGSTGNFLKGIFGITCIQLVLQASFQIALVCMSPYAELFMHHPLIEVIFRYVGIVRLDNLSVTYILIWIGPEIIMFVATLAFLITFKKLNTNDSLIVRSEAGTIRIEDRNEVGSQVTLGPKAQNTDYTQYFVAFGRYLILLMLCLAGVVRPSIEAGIYYLFFLAIASWWASYKQLKRGFAKVLRCLIPLVVLHLIALYVINFKIVQEQIPEDGRYSRYFDLLPFVTDVSNANATYRAGNPSMFHSNPIEYTLKNESTLEAPSIGNNSTDVSSFEIQPFETSTDPRIFLFYFHRDITFYIYPAILYMLYFLLVLESKELLKPEQKKQGSSFSQIEEKLTRSMSRRLSKKKLLTPTAAQKWQKASRKVRLLRGVSPKRRNKTPNRSSLHQDSTGSVTVNENEDIQMEIFEDEEDYDLTFFHNVIFALEAIIQKVVRSSYIATNIIMMAWSITYLSWLTFVLLLWANIIWLIPNQRKRMLTSSPFLVLYALFLLISAYIYSINLTEEELPSMAQGVDLKEIGFKKPEGPPCIPLLVKSLYTVMFWITLRQYTQEELEKRQTSALADMVAPLQVTVGAAGVKKEQETSGSELMAKIGKFIHKFLIKFWIWVVAITLFAVAITGQRMTVFRILYMALFLFFILSFQFSFKVWRKVMFGFLLTVIIYSMIILILIYTYQFDKFPDYWTDYLHIQIEQQHDIGLEQYQTKQLFVRLVTPTFFVIVTVLQLHYFHNDFMELTDMKRRSLASDNTNRETENNEDVDDSSLQGGAFLDRSDMSAPSKYYTDVSFYDLDVIPSEVFKKWLKKIISVLVYTKHIIYLFLEIHMLKIVLFFAMLMSVYDKCALYIIIVLLLSIAFTCGRNCQIFVAYFTSLFVSLLILLRMIYQISYIDSTKWNVTCTATINPNVNDTVVNNGPWLGFDKLHETEENLPELVKWNIIFIVVMTLWKVVEVRQYNYRLSRGRPTTKRYFMFPKTTREDADKSLSDFFKYMANFGFYKFGLEISFILVVMLIGVRMDLYSLIHSIWLLAMFGLARQTLSRLWPVYLIFIAFSIPFQYFMAIGLPPSLCIEFPWDNPTQTMKNLQDWAFLLDTYTPPIVEKLVFDFLLLVGVSRQWLVFRIEKRYEGQNYAGGSNESIIHNAEEKDFVNPVPDFITYVRSYLDIAKKAVLQSFLWVTLAVVFLAGTSRVNIFSIGYLLFAFLFLWHGSDFYLRPIHKILFYWNRLLGFNVTVILCKCIFQILGCIFPHEISLSYCWLIQIFGITCVKNFVHHKNLLNLAEDDVDNVCSIAKDGLTWDVICFTLLIFQKRLFNSYNFFHIADDAKATAILASRGAELMEEMRTKTMKDQEETERRVLEKIREKMERIKANQQKIQESSFSGRPRYRSHTPRTHPAAVRSGDYYMFDEIENDDIDLLPEEKESIDELDEGPTPYLADIAEQEPKSVRIQDDAEPSTSQQPDEDFSSFTETEKRKPLQKIFACLLFLWAFIDGAMVSLTRYLNKYSRNYRLILKILSKEKRILKEQTDYNIGIRTGKEQIWHPAGSFHTLVRHSKPNSIRSCVSEEEKPPLSEDSDTKAVAPSLPCSPEVDRRKASVLTVPEIRILAASLERGLDSPCSPCSSRKSEDPEGNEGNAYLEYGDEMSSVDQPTFFRLVLAIWYLIMSRSEIVCYFVIFMNQMRNANLISLPLPLMVFFWGSLTIPRPSKTFWVTIIAYTEVVVLLKCLFQFDIMPGNKVRAQTEFITSVTAQNPFYPPVLIGLHKQDSVQAMWDLLLLLVVFFHRVLLKSMGIWSSSAPVSTVLLEDGQYKVVGENFIALENEIDEESEDEDEEEPSNAVSKRKTDNLPINENQDDVVVIKSRRLSKIHNAISTVRMGMTKYAEHMRLFIQQLLDPTSRVTADVYSLMFLCDFVNFFVILFGYSAFGSQQDGDVSSYLEDDRVPPLFLFMLILQFTMIIVDRGIYLRKNILAKIIFQFTQIIVLHIWLFLLFPIITRKYCNSLIPPQIYYISKCIYLLLSAYQIRCGYPTRILGNFLCKGYGYVNMFLFKGFMLVPFLFELRTCMDWMWTETSMTIFDWIKMEDIYQNIFLLKCSREVEDEFPQPRAEKKKPLSKYMMGGALLALIIAIIWFPLVFFSLGNAVGNPNPPIDVTLEVRIGPYESLYKMSAQSNSSIIQFTPNEMEEFRSLYNAYAVSENFMYNYEAADVAAIKLSTDSANTWGISPPDRKRLITEVMSDKPLPFRMEFKITHKTSKAEDSGIIINGVDSKIYPNTPARENLLKMLQHQGNVQSVELKYILPKFIKVTNRGTANPIDVLMLEKPDPEAKTYRNITINLSTESDAGLKQEWWKIKEECSDYNYLNFLNKITHNDCENYIILYCFNDKVFPPTLSFLTAGGIIGLYTTIVFVASRFLRGFFADGFPKIMFEDLPNVDRVLRLCLDIYLVREAAEFGLEEDLFAKLVFLYRSPETLIKWTRPKEEVADDDDPEGEGAGAAN